MNSVKRSMNEEQKSLDSQLWHACAGCMVRIPPLNSRVLYFPQGHAEHSGDGNVDFGDNRIPPYILCQVTAVKLLADLDTDEVYAKISLLPLKSQSYCDSDDDGFLRFDRNENEEKSASFVKTLTQSDANNGGGFSVPRYCADAIFPKLDYTADPPFQIIFVKDVHGQIWKFRHIYRGNPRRHLLTTGWGNFVDNKKLVAGDSVVFFRGDNGDICIGIRRLKRRTGGGRFAGIGSENETLESVIEAASLAAAGEPSDVKYYPRASTPEFCVKASAVKAAMKIRWCPGMRFTMAFETEDSSRISWFMGTVSSVRADDQTRWPSSPWRRIQVIWDEPELLQNVNRVNPWSVELLASTPGVHVSMFPPPTKKLRFIQPTDYSFPMPPSIQGARHCSQFGLDHNQTHLFSHGSDDLVSSGRLQRQERDENISCLLTIGTDNYDSSLKKKKDEKDAKTDILVLFGQPILTEPQLSVTGSSDTNGSVVRQSGSVRASSEEVGPLVESGSR